MLYIDKRLVDHDIINSNFCCDLGKCNGACCTFPGERGAPLQDHEVPLLVEAYNIVKDLLPAKALEVIKQNGVYEGHKGDYTTVCINKRDCVFVYYEGSVAKCAIEKGYFEGRLSFRKPISCHLFPIRVTKMPAEHLYYERIPECGTAITNGNTNKIQLIDCVRDAIVREFGEDFYVSLKDYSLQQNK
jgi:hypothetical protein